MHIFVKVSSTKTITVQAMASDTIGSIKTKIYNREGVPPDQQLLMFAGIELADAHRLSYYDIRDVSTLHMAVRMSPLAAELAMVRQRVAQVEAQLQETEAARASWAAEALRLGWGTSASASGRVAVADAPTAASSSGCVAAESHTVPEAADDTGLNRRQKKRRRQQAAKVLW